MNSLLTTENTQTSVLHNPWGNFKSIDTFFVSFADNPSASGATIYANGRHQVAVMITLRANATDGGYLPLNAEDLRAAVHLYSTGNSGKRLHTAVQEDTPWLYSHSSQGFTTPLSWLLQDKREENIKRHEEGMAHAIVYVTCTPSSNLSPLNLSGAIQIGEDKYTTEQSKPAANHVHLSVNAQPSVSYSDKDLQLDRYGSSSYTVAGLGDIDQVNSYLKFKNSSLLMKSSQTTVNAECWQGNLDATSNEPANAFYTSYSTDKSMFYNGFVWPMPNGNTGKSKSVTCTIYAKTSTAGDTYGAAYLSSTDKPISFSTSPINEWENCLCFTRLLLTNCQIELNDLPELESKYYNAYVTYYDQYGNSGQTALGPYKENPTATNLGNIISIRNWKDIFGSVSEMYLQFADSVSASSATIYANGANQVEVVLGVHVLDSYGITIPLTRDSLSGNTALCQYIGGTSLKWNGTAQITSDTWGYSGKKNRYCQIAEIQRQQNRVIRSTTTGTAFISYYVYSQQNGGASQTDLAMSLTVNNKTYSTAQGNQNYSANNPQKIHIATKANPNYKYSGKGEAGEENNDSNVYMTRENTETIENVSAYNALRPDMKSNTWKNLIEKNANKKVDQDNYYVTLKNPNDSTVVLGNIVLLGSPNGGQLSTYTDPDGNKVQAPSSFYFNHSNDVGTLCAIIWPQAAAHESKVVITYEYDNPLQSATDPFSIRVCQRNTSALCLTRLMTSDVSTHSHYGYYNCSVILSDQYGNSVTVSFPYESSGVTIKIKNGI